MKLLKKICQLIFPPKCLFCQKVLEKDQQDLCPVCADSAPNFTKSKNKHSFIARWTCLWYYKDKARRAILRFKFYKRRSYAISFGRMLAKKLLAEGFTDFDILTWVPISKRRRFHRSYDQVQVLAQAVGKELGIPAVATLKKIRHTKAQSRIKGAAHRRGNVVGAYQVIDPALVQGKRILLLDDIITTGATASECAKTLHFSCVNQVIFAALAAAEHPKK